MTYDNTQALSEGWDIFECDEPSRFEIQRLDDPGSVPSLGFLDPVFESDDEALSHVFARARAGSAYHRAALEWLDAKNHSVRTGQ